MERYQGVQALFNGDLHRVLPDWAPREDWVVGSVTEIRLANPNQEEASVSKEETLHGEA